MERLLRFALKNTDRVEFVDIPPRTISYIKAVDEFDEFAGTEVHLLSGKMLVVSSTPGSVKFSLEGALGAKVYYPKPQRIGG